MTQKLIGLKVIQTPHWENEKIILSPMRLVYLKPQEKLEVSHEIHVVLLGDIYEQAYAIFNPLGIDYDYPKLIEISHEFDNTIGNGSHALIGRKGAENLGEILSPQAIKQAIIEYKERLRRALQW